MIKAIFFDIDGTLLSIGNQKIPDSTVKALKKAKEKGIKLIVATGRHGRRILAFWKMFFILTHM